MFMLKSAAVSSLLSLHCPPQDFGSLSNLQVTQPTVGMNFKQPRGV